MPAATTSSPLRLAVEQAVNNVNNVNNINTNANGYDNHASALSMSRKRRRDDLGLDALDARDAPEHLAALSHLSSSSSPATMRKMLPFPAPKKARLAPDTASDLSCPPPPSPSPQKPTRSWSSKARDDQSTPTAAASNLSSSVAPAPPSSAFAFSSSPLLSSSTTHRCHICYRKPTKKSDLDSFADCQGCGQRTCFVCIRECMGWMPGLRDGESSAMLDGSGHTHDHDNSAADERADSSLTMQDVGETGGGREAAESLQTRAGRPDERDDPRRGDTAGNDWAEGGHRQMVCSRCCIERGSDGDVVCLGCLPFVEG